MVAAGVLPREIELKKELDSQRQNLKETLEMDGRKTIMRRIADLEMRLAIEQEARRKFYRTS